MAAPTRAARALAWVAPVLLVAFAVATRLTFTAHLDYHAEPEHELGNAAAWLAAPDLAAPGPPIGFGADDRYDAGAAYSIALAPFLALERSPFAIVWLHGAIAVVGLLSVLALARRELGPLWSTFIGLGYLASGSWLGAWERHQWHCHAIVGLMAAQCWLARHLVDRPTVWRFGALAAVGAFTAQLYVAAGAMVFAHLVMVVFIALEVWRRRVAPETWVGGLAFGLVAASPILLRFYATSGAAVAPSEGGGASGTGIATLSEGLALLIEHLSPSWTLVRHIGGVGYLLAVLAVVGIVTLARRRSPFDLFVLAAIAGTTVLGLGAFAERGEPRYLLGVPPLLFIAAAVGCGTAARPIGRWLARSPRLRATMTHPIAIITVVTGVLLGPSLVPGRGGWVEGNVIAAPVAGERIGGDLRLGLGEQSALVRIARAEWGWDFARICRRLHGLVCDAKHGIGSFAALMEPPTSPHRDLDVLLEVPGSVMRIPDERRTGTRTFSGAFGRELTFVAFTPAFESSGIALDRFDRGGGSRRCADAVPFNSSYSTTVASKLYAASTRLDVPWSERPGRCRGEDTDHYRLWLPVRLTEGSAQVVVGYEDGDATELVRGGALRRHGAAGAGPSEPLSLVTGGNEGDLAVIGVRWEVGTVALELTFPGDAEIKLVDAF